MCCGLLCSFQACDVVNRPVAKPPKFEVIPEDSENSREKDSAPLLMSSPLPAVLIPVPETPARKTSRHWVRKSDSLIPRCIKGIIIYLCIVNYLNSSSLSAVSRQHLCLAAAGLPCPGRGALPGLCALLAAGLLHTCSQDERTHTEHHPPHGAGGHSDSQTGKGTR